MFTFNIDPVLFSLGPLEVRYYGLMYVVGVIIVYFLLVKLSKEKQVAISKDQVESLVVYCLVGGLIGARIVYVLVYNFAYYLQHPLEMLMIWQGGLSFHGGLLGGALAGYWFCKKHKLRFFQLADLMMIPFALALFFGRIGNFLNGELFGRITSLPWAVKFPDAEGFRHPSQLYEALKNMMIFSVLWFSRKKDHKEGYLFWMFIFLYGSLRFLIEFTRMPDPQLGFIVAGLSMGQLLCIPMIILGGIMLVRSRK